MGVISNGTTLLDAGALDSGIATGAMTLLSTLTASSSANLTFASGISSTYKEYIFKFIDIHPATDNVGFTANFRDGSSAYDATKTTTHFYAYHSEGDSAAAFGYRTDQDLAQATGTLNLGIPVGADADQCITGTLRLFEPSSTTFVKHFKSSTSNYMSGSAANNYFSAGYFNTTSALNAFDFKFHSGNIDSGVIKLYGVS